MTARPGPTVSTMRHVLWIGGSSCAGKTTVATRLARPHGLRVYSADTRTWVHRDRAIAAGNAAALRWESLEPAARWDRSPDDLFEMSLHRERGQMVIDDVASMPTSPLIVAEGTTLPAAAVSAGIPERSRAVWLIPTDGFEEAQLDAAGTTGGARVLSQLLKREIEREAQESGVPTLTVDGTRGVPEMIDAVERLFSEELAAGPKAATPQERRGLLREFNEAVVAQVRGYYARPWAEGDPDEVTRPFVCECGDRSCDVDLLVTVRQAAAGPVLAPGHRARSPSAGGQDLRRRASRRGRGEGSPWPGRGVT